MSRAAYSHFIKASIATAVLFFSNVIARGDSPDEFIKKGDSFDVSLQAPEALQAYKQAERKRPNDPSLLVRIARQYRHLMSDAQTAEEKVRLGSIALLYGKRAAVLAPADSDAQLSSAISYGKLVPYLEKKEQVADSIKIKAAAERAVKLNPRNDLAWHVLGRWHREVSAVSSVKRALAGMMYEKLPEASNAEAVTCFQKAIELCPNRPMHYIELGRVYAQMGQKVDARRFLEKGLALPNEDKDDPERKAQGREALTALR